MSSILHEVKNVAGKTATFGMGCFWANDALYGALKGVLRTTVGYAGGTTVDPSYKNIGDHTEVIQIHFDPKLVSYEKLLELFWENHEYGLTSQVKRQYLSMVLYYDDEQKSLAENSAIKKSSEITQKLITEIKPASTFYPAEDYHQKYRLQRHPYLCRELSLNSELLQSSYAAARINGFVAGVGNEEFFTQEINSLGLEENVKEYVKNEWKSNKGGTLYC